jgi:teichuronic acid biosynthesis glycosyltransferase TuaG
MSTVTVITPAYNAAQYLSDTIRSVQAQTFKDWEMIIVDDCSTDETFKIATSFSSKDSRIHVVKHTMNSGVAVARNTALDAAKTEFVAFLDSDDLWMPNKLEKQLDFMEKNGYVLTYTDYQLFNTDTGEVIKKIKSPKKMTYKSIFTNTGIGCLTVMVDKNISGEFHMPLLKHTEDNCTWQTILKPGYTAYLLDENLASYRVGNVSLTKDKSKSAKNQWDYYRKYYKFSVLKSAYYFCGYAINAVKKHYF